MSMALELLWTIQDLGFRVQGSGFNTLTILKLPFCGGNMSGAWAWAGGKGLGAGTSQGDSMTAQRTSNGFLEQPMIGSSICPIVGNVVQGYLTCKRMHPPRTLPYAYA